MLAVAAVVIGGTAFPEGILGKWSDPLEISVMGVPDASIVDVTDNSINKHHRNRRREGNEVAFHFNYVHTVPQDAQNAIEAAGHAWTEVLQ